MAEHTTQELPALWANLCERVGLEAARLTPALHTPEGYIFCARCSLSEAAFFRDRILQERGGEALWPVLLGIDDDLSLHEETLSYAMQAPAMAQMLQEADHIHRRLERGEAFADVVSGEDEDELRVSMIGYKRETTLEEISVTGIALAPEPLAMHIERLRSAAGARAAEPEDEQVFLGLCPQAYGWQVPALLRVGGYNDHPAPWEHAALHRHWLEVWGARLVAITPSRVELLVSLLPKNWEEAFSLAQQHIDYCPDLIRAEGVNLRQMAERLRVDPLWSFEWS